MPKKIVLLGSTGSIGVQTLEVVRRYPNLFAVEGIGAGGSNPRMLLEQAVKFRVPYIGFSFGDRHKLAALLGTIKQEHNVRDYDPSFMVFPESAARLAALENVLVVNAITGSVGLGPTLAALEAGNKLALANKESLVVGGQLVVDAAGKRDGSILDAIYPVDSEHSAIMQCLPRRSRAEAEANTRPDPSKVSMQVDTTQVDRLIITASGGPFRGRTRQELAQVNAQEAMKHPTWNMGTVITINSSTLVNKGLEVMEASLLFDIPVDRIDTVVHPQSIVHSMVQYVDGSIIAQASAPSMKLPIALALGAPERLAGVVQPLNFRDAGQWTFEPLDDEVFPAVKLARNAWKQRGSFPAVYNAANEEAVVAFMEDNISFLDISAIIESALSAHEDKGELTLEAVLAAEKWARHYARQRISERVKA